MFVTRFKIEFDMTLCISFVSIRGLLPYLWQLSIGTFLFIATRGRWVTLIKTEPGAILEEKIPRKNVNDTIC